MDKKEYFLEIFKKADKTYGKSTYRLAGDAWPRDWQTLITTIMSAQSRDETTIKIAEALFARYPTLQSLADASYEDVLQILRSMNYNRTKAKNVIGAARYLIDHHQGEVPQTLEELVGIPGVGRKTANLVIAECFGKEGICVDTHVHRLVNVLSLAKTKTPHQTELALMELAPRKYWSRINRLFVLWGKDVRGRDKKRILEKLER